MGDGYCLYHSYRKLKCRSPLKVAHSTLQQPLLSHPQLQRSAAATYSTHAGRMDARVRAMIDCHTLCKFAAMAFNRIVSVVQKNKKREKRPECIVDVTQQPQSKVSPHTAPQFGAAMSTACKGMGGSV